MDGADRVVVTGMGVVTTIGDSIETFFDALIKGTSGITRWKAEEELPYSKIGGDLSDFDVRTHLSDERFGYDRDLRDRARRLLRATPLSGRLSAAAALQAYADSGLEDALVPAEERAHVLAGHNLNGGYIVENVHAYREDDPEYIDALFGLMCMDTDVLAVGCELLDLKGPSLCVGGACASGNIAIQTAFDLLRLGRAGVAVVTGAALDTDPVALQGWAMIDAISCESFNAEPERASRPFDRRREGFVPAQGAAALVLEPLALARGRGARLYGEVLGTASVSDASRLTKPHEAGQTRAMLGALAEARRSPADVDYVNAHATSTVLGDAVEVQAIKRVFGGHARRIPVNSTKSMIGHNLAAAGVVECVATLLQMKHGIVHPTINLEDPDPELDLDFVPNQARGHEIRIALSNSFGFGGLNSTVVLGRP